ncbi:hypothetical protein HDU85_001908 [Gaertneriomyces sp. JEL0708]|nr:hypothetical protein HDU85_001908 [Gaertneriomyces sp. JEL0708]
MAAWTEPYDATFYRPGCPQRCIPAQICPEKTSEDCLHLSIYTPTIVEDFRTLQKPVLFFIPGGTFLTGSDELYDFAEVATALDAVCVVTNYRLGLLGFFATESTVNPNRLPNFGLQDIRMAHQWVRDNIAAVGGDPENVVLAGQSAGGLAGSWLLGAGGNDPVNVKAAVLLSMPNLAFRSYSEAWGDAVTLMKELGCGTDFSCAMSKSTKELLDGNARLSDARTGRIIYDPLLPIVDRHEVLGSPMKILRESFVPKFPLLIGTVEAEAQMLVDALGGRPNSKITAESMWYSLLPAVHKQATDFYPDSPVLYKGTLDYTYMIRNMSTDYLFVCPTRRVIQGLAARTENSLYGYQFAAGLPIVEGVSTAYADEDPGHGVDLLYLVSTDETTRVLSEALKLTLKGLLHHADPNVFSPSGGPSFMYPNMSRASLEELSVIRFDDTWKNHGGFQRVQYPRSEYCDYWDSLPYDDPYDVRALFPTASSPLILPFMIVFAALLATVFLLQILALARARHFTLRSRAKPTVEDNAFSATTGIGSALPLACHLLDFRVPGDASRFILSDVSLYFPPGSFNAIMGPSGAGKTSLMNLLTGKVIHPVSSKRIFLGSMSLNHTPLQKLKQLLGYVEQTDCPYSSMTVRTVLRSAALCLLPSDMNDNEKSRRVDEVVDMVNLSSCLDTPILPPGTPGGISGGQLRRVTIALQLLKMPPILYLDEPTSGLDAETSYEIVQCLKRISLTGRHSVILTIHMPRREIWDAFDQVVIMASGRVCAAGPPHSVTHHFKRALNLLHMPSKSGNPADWIIDAVGSAKAHELEELMATYRNSSLYGSTIERIRSMKIPAELSSNLSLHPSSTVGTLNPCNPRAVVVNPAIERIAGSDSYGLAMSVSSDSLNQNIHRPRGLQSSGVRRSVSAGDLTWEPLTTSSVSSGTTDTSLPGSDGSGSTINTTGEAVVVRAFDKQFRPLQRSTSMSYIRRSHPEPPLTHSNGEKKLSRAASLDRPTNLRRMATDCSLDRYDTASDDELAESQVTFQVGDADGGRPARATTWTMFWSGTERWWHTGTISSKFSVAYLSMILGLLMGAIFNRDDRDEMRLVLRVVGWQTAVLGMHMLKNTQMTILLPLEFTVYRWEMRQGMTSVFAFWLRMFVVDHIINVVESVPGALGMFATMDREALKRIGALDTILSVFVYVITATSLSSAIMALPLDYRTAGLLAVGSLGVVGLFSGVFLKEGSTPVYDALIWLQYVSPPYWGLQALSSSTVGGRGACVLQSPMNKDECSVTQGDLVIKTINGIWPSHAGRWVALSVLLIGDLALRFIQLSVLYLDCYYPTIKWRFRRTLRRFRGKREPAQEV